MGKYKLSTILTIAGLIFGIPATIIAFQTISVPWAPRSQVERIDTQVVGLRYESLMAAYLKCQSNLRKNPNDLWLRKQCVMLRRMIMDLQRRNK